MVKFHFLQKQKERINGKEIVYHGSMKPGMKVITPNKCKHEKAYVYASENLALSIIFGVKRKGENIEFGVNFFGKTFVKEYYPKAFEDRFKGRKGYVYKLYKKDLVMETEYIELVSTKPVEVVECLEIDDCADFLINLEKEGKFKIYRYEKLSKKEKERMQNSLEKIVSNYLKLKDLSDEEVESLSEREKLSYNINKERKDFCIKKFPEIVKKLNNK